MSQIVPSYMLKIARAEEHLNDLTTEVARYSNRHPYTVDTRHYRKRDEHRLAFTEDPINTHIGVVLADLIHNLTSGLDHLIADMVPPKDRKSVMFPVLWEGVWENAVPGENKQRAKDRARWKTITRNMSADAVALLQKMQPPAQIPENTEVPALLAIHRLSNTDKHSNLPILPTSLRNAEVSWTDRDGERHVGRDLRTFDGLTAVEDGAIINFPNGAVDVAIKGTAVVGVRIVDPGRDIEIPHAIEKVIPIVREYVMAPLMNYLHGSPPKRR
jgi:hypothetical protein